jgi:hypothetical protein
MRLAASWLAEKQHRAALLDEPQRREVLDQFAVHRGLELEVELVDGASEREPRVAQAGGHPPVAGGGGLAADEFGEERQMRPVLVAGGLGQRGECLRGVTELQVAEVVLELLVDPAGHGATVPPVQPQPSPYTVRSTGATS